MTERFTETADAMNFSGEGFELHNVLRGDEQQAKRALVNSGMPVDYGRDLGVGWLTAASRHYNISPDPKDYVMAPVTILVSSIPNRNGVAFPLRELAEFDPEMGMLSYQTWGKKPVFYEHCVPANTPVVTKSGHKPIGKIKIGDKVLTHTGSYKNVIRIYDNGVKPTRKIYVHGLPQPLTITDNHPVYIVDRRQLFGLSVEGALGTKYSGLTYVNQLRRKAEIDEVHPHFRPASDVYKGDYVVRPIYVGGDHAVDADWAYLVGAFAAEGSYIKKTGTKARIGVNFTIAYNEKVFGDAIVSKFAALGFQARRYYRKEAGTQNIIVHGRELAQAMFDAVGEYSHKKHLKSVRSWDAESLKHFAAGYIDGDGHVCRTTGRIRIATVSYQLAIDVQTLLARLNLLATVTKSSNGGTMTGVGTYKYRTYKCRATYHIGVNSAAQIELADYVNNKTFNHQEDRSQGRTNSIVVGDLLLLPIHSVVENSGKSRVYNLEVADDNSYVANSFVLHNCNEDHTKALGVIFDVHMSAAPQFAGDTLHKVITLCGVDRTRSPMLANRLLTGSLRTWSMGATLTGYECSVCGHRPSKANPKCEHFGLNNRNMRIFEDPKRGRVLAHYICSGIRGFETSMVEVPAWASAQHADDQLLLLDGAQ